MPFTGIDQQAFATYAPEKWSSNVYNLPRMKVKETMLALGELVQERLSAELAGLSRAASDDVPNIANHKKVDSQWVYWFRDPAERDSLASFLQKTPLDEKIIFNIAPQDKHATLAVILRQSGLWIGLRIAAGAVVDRRNVASKLAKSWEREKLKEMLAELPEGTVIGPEDAAVSTAELSLDAIGELGGHLGVEDPTWLIGHAVTADEVLEFGAELVDHVGRWLGVLAPVYRFAAWSRDNDHIEAVKQIQDEKAQQRKQAANYKKGDTVRIITGLFSGKIGTIESVDSKSQVKVRVGKMSVVVSGTGLTPVRA